MADAAVTMMCPRCYQQDYGSGACPKCGRALQPVKRMKGRGWVTLFAGALMTVLIVALWGYVAHLFATHPHAVLSSYDAAVRGRTFVSFALIFVSGILGIASGTLQLRSGRRSRVLTFAIVVAFGAAIGTTVLGST